MTAKKTAARKNGDAKASRSAKTETHARKQVKKTPSQKAAAKPAPTRTAKPAVAQPKKPAAKAAAPMKAAAKTAALKAVAKPAASEFKVAKPDVALSAKTPAPKKAAAAAARAKPAASTSFDPDRRRELIAAAAAARRRKTAPVVITAPIAIAPQREPGPAERHRFSVGDEVRVISTSGMWFKHGIDYRVTAALPPQGGKLQYRIKNEQEPFERVVSESQLASAGASAAHGRL